MQHSVRSLGVPSLNIANRDGNNYVNPRKIERMRSSTFFCVRARMAPCCYNFYKTLIWIVLPYIYTLGYYVLGITLPSSPSLPLVTHPSPFSHSSFNPIPAAMAPPTLIERERAAASSSSSQNGSRPLDQQGKGERKEERN